MIGWFKKLLWIVRDYDLDREIHRAWLARLERVIAERTELGVDVNFRGLNHVIMVGRYKNNDYVQAFSIDERDMGGLIDRLKEMERHATVKRVDAPPMFQAVIKRSLHE